VFVVSQTEVLGDRLQEVFFPLVVVSQTARRVEDETEIGFATILSVCQSNEGGNGKECDVSPHPGSTVPGMRGAECLVFFNQANTTCLNPPIASK